MATRTHLDSSVTERRLRPIYDCLDNGNNKKAIQEAEKVLKKQKDFQCAKVLKALALLRLGKHEESVKLLQEVHSEVPTDDATLQAMTICYRELHRLDLIAEVYEAATQKDPQNEELLTHLFMAYVRLGEYKKQQQVAINLYKLKAKNPYYFWGVMSIVMQAHDAPEEIAQKMLLPLAERMTEKFVRENKIEAEAEVQLYLLILQLEHKYQEALDVIDGHLGEKLTTFLNFKDNLRAELLNKLGRWSGANTEYKLLIGISPDNWKCFCEYISTTLKLVDCNYEPTETERSIQSVDYTIPMARNFITKLVEVERSKAAGKSLRGPFLAYISLACQTLKYPDTFSSQELLVELFTDYFHRFGDKPCYFSDVFNMLSYLSNENMIKFLNQVKSIVDLEPTGDEVSFPADHKQLQQHLSYCHLQRFLGTHSKLNLTDKVQMATELLRRYHHAGKFGDKLLSTDVKPNDGYSILASHILVDVWRETGDTKMLCQILVILEGALKNSPSNYQIKLLLIKLYNTIGAVGSSFTLYESMDIKHIQQDVLGYLVTRHIAAKGHFAQACIIFGNMLKFFTANYKDTVDYLIASYKFGSFTKIQELVDFRERLNNSLQYATVSVERMIQDLILETNNHSATEQIIIYMEIDPEKDKTVWEDLRDNRDLDIMISYDPLENRVSDRTKRLSFDAEVEWLKLCNLLVRCLAAAHLVSTHCPAADADNHLNNSHVDGSKRSPVDLMSDLLDQFRELVKGRNPEEFQLPQDPIQGPFVSRLLNHLKGCYFKPVISLLSLILRLHKAYELSENEKTNNIIENTIIKEITECVSKTIGSLTADNFTILTKVSDVLEDLVNVSEMLSFVAVLLGFCSQIIKQAKGTRGKKGKKRKESQNFRIPSLIEDFNNLVKDVENLAQQLHHSIRDVQFQSLVSHFEKASLENNGLPENENECLVQEVTKKIEKSYQQSLNEVADLVQNKLKYLANLRL